jgi:hypothetical protein
MSAESNRRQKLCRDAGCFCTREGFNREIAHYREALERICIDAKGIAPFQGPPSHIYQEAVEALEYRDD